MTSKGSLMDFLWKFDDNRHSTARKFAQERRKMNAVAFKWIENRRMKNLDSTMNSSVA